LAEILPEFQSFFSERSSGYNFKGKVNFSVDCGLAVFIKKNLKVVDSRVADFGPSLGIKEDPVEGNTKAQELDLAFEGKTFSIINYHGPALPGNKLDTPERIANSQSLKAIWDNFPAKPKILCGDFNLLPQTQSIKILEGCGKNLIKEFKITNTRNEISWQKYQNNQSFADFVFVSPAINIKNFVVPYNLVSDHLPLILEFTI
jgi:exonuclease III